MKEQRRWILCEILLFVAIIILSIVFCFNLNKNLISSFEYIDRGLPVFSLNLNDITWEEFKNGGKETKYAGNELKIYDINHLNIYENVEIKGRGNSTWLQDKKPLQVKLEQSIDLFGLGKTKKWVLLANYFDKSYLRTDTAFAVAEMLEENYSHRGKYVELYVNGEYEGLYYLLKKVQIQKDVVDLRDEAAILVELDNLQYYGEQCFISYDKNCLLIKDTVVGEEDELSTEIMKNFLLNFNQLEKAAQAKDYLAIERLIDVESFAKHFLVNEFTVNPDAYSTSFYLYKNGVNDKIHAGPAWDFDFALGNKEWIWVTVDGFFSPDLTMVRKQQVYVENDGERDKSIARLFYWLMEIPEFKNEVKRVFQDKMSGREKELELTIKNTADSIKESALLDGEKWDRGDFNSELDYLLEWVEERFEYFEEIYGDNDEDPALRIL